MRVLLLAWLLAASSSFALTRDGFSDALAARAMLAPDTWARVVRIRNEGNHGLERRTPYPSITYALLFEFSGILWFYCDEDGTQSLSVRLGYLEADKANPGPLLKAVCPRFASWEWADRPGSRGRERGARAPNDCFLECLALLRQRAAAATGPCSPTLLFFYVNTPHGPLGHTVLVLQEPDGVTAVDPDHPGAPIRVPAFASADARSLARFLRGGEVASARTLALDPFGLTKPEPKWTALPRPAVPAG